jgi:hypothetical protein
MTEQEAYDEVRYYTLSLGDPEFIHQHVVDAFTAQHADEHTKPIAITFALVGLYLHVEKGFTGREVQRAHMELARHKRSWPRFELPDDRGPMTVFDVVAASAGPERDRAIHEWCVGVWRAYGEQQRAVVELLRSGSSSTECH